jgi:hypothetical protein
VQIESLKDWNIFLLCSQERFAGNPEFLRQLTTTNININTDSNSDTNKKRLHNSAVQELFRAGLETADLDDVVSILQEHGAKDSLSEAVVMHCNLKYFKAIIKKCDPMAVREQVIFTLCKCFLSGALPVFGSLYSIIFTYFW